ncbi:hypothetical protein [Paraburkholderia bryophila]|uniref:Uncharacterized protein n=1 Tax=Paraburkholderia bryophila TaxID=420952 RepID=A0A7Y9WNK6_9BURK|nr:hypothetical protein [Paraburkholderia bryophila]NYH24220.1 hypothetical protein [Paraburkholderia bryophila]
MALPRNLQRFRKQLEKSLEAGERLTRYDRALIADLTKLDEQLGDGTALPALARLANDPIFRSSSARSLGPRTEVGPLPVKRHQNPVEGISVCPTCGRPLHP